MMAEKKILHFRSMDSLQNVVSIINEASAALKDKNRTILESPISEVLSGALGAGVGGAVSFAALWGLGTVGLSAAGITSALAAAGSIIAGGMVAGVFVLAVPVAIGSAIGCTIWRKKTTDRLNQEKSRLYQEALKKHEAIIKALREEADACKERIDYLQSLNILLQQAIKDLKSDLGVA